MKRQPNISRRNLRNLGSVGERSTFSSLVTARVARSWLLYHKTNEREKERGFKEMVLGAHPSGDARQQRARAVIGLDYSRGIRRMAFNDNGKELYIHTCVYYYLLTITRLTPKIFWLKYFIESETLIAREGRQKKKEARTASHIHCLAPLWLYPLLKKISIYTYVYEHMRICIYTYRLCLYIYIHDTRVYRRIGTIIIIIIIMVTRFLSLLISSSLL